MARQGRGNACRDRQGHEWKAKPACPDIDMLAMETACVTGQPALPTIESFGEEVGRFERLFKR